MIVYVTYTGTVYSGYDYAGIFGPANTSLAGDSYTVTYKFDTTIPVNSPYNHPIGGWGTATWQQSPSLGAVLTLNDHSVDIDGQYAGELLNSANYLYADAREFYYTADGYAYNIVTNFIQHAAPDLASLTQPYNYIAASGDSVNGYFQIRSWSDQYHDQIYAVANFSPAAVTLSQSAIAPAVKVSLTNDTGSSSSDKITNEDPGLTGSADPNAVVHITIDGTVVGTATADENGVWSFTPTGLGLADGFHTVVASETDAVGNPGNAALGFTLDTTAPTVLITGTSQINEDSVAFDGISDPGTHLNIFDGATLLGTAIASSTGDWSFTANVSATQVHHFTAASAPDTAGNVGVTPGTTEWGTGKNNTIISTAGNDTLYGNAGADTLAGLGGADTVNGGEGRDTATYGASPTGVDVSLMTGLGSGGDAQGDTLINIENLTGSAFNDTLEGNGGNNVLVGGAGIDTLSYEHATSGVTVGLAITAAQNSGGAGTDTVSGFENLTGSAFATS
jgi:Ca2+-binding RTX toxin-like protein